MPPRTPRPAAAATKGKPAKARPAARAKAPTKARPAAKAKSPPKARPAARAKAPTKARPSGKSGAAPRGKATPGARSRVTAKLTPAPRTAAPRRPARGGTARKSGPAAGQIRSVLQPSANNPLVSIRLFFQVGSASDPPGKQGLAALTAAMLGEGGSRVRSYSEVLDALYPLAARILSHGDRESIVFHGTVHQDNLPRYAELLGDQILQPGFAEDDFQRTRQDAIDYITKSLRGNDDEALGKEALAALLYRDHPYGHPAQGTEAGLRAITLSDVKTFYQQHFTRDRLIVGLAGGYPQGFAEGFLGRLAGLPARGKPLPRLPPPPRRNLAEVLLVEKDAAAVAISIGHPLRITRTHPDFYPLTVARSYLGEHRTFNGVLMQRMRGLRGLNYGDYAYIENFIQDGGSTFPLPNIPRRQQHFEIWIRPVQPANALFALRQAIHETEKLVREGIPAQAFEETRRFLLNYSRLWTQDASRRLGYAIDGLVYGKELITELSRRLPAMTKADVDRAVRKHLTPRHWAAALVTPRAEQVREQLLQGSPTPIVYDTGGTPPEILEEDQVIEKLPLPVFAPTTTVRPVELLFAR
jgi:zinc protease